MMSNDQDDSVLNQEIQDIENKNLFRKVWNSDLKAWIESRRRAGSISTKSYEWAMRQFRKVDLLETSEVLEERIKND